MPRRYYEYPPEYQVLERHVDGRRVDPGRRLRAAAGLPAVFAAAAADAGPNPWGATGLEWQTDSPPPVHNFDEVPVVTQSPVRLFSRRSRGRRGSDRHHASREREHGSAIDEPILAHQFDDLEQQSEASTLGMWLFLATEVMFFGGLITAYAVYRATSPREVALASRHLNVGLGCLNTVVLLGSSLTMALAVRAAQLRAARPLVLWLLADDGPRVPASSGSRPSNTQRSTTSSLIPGWNFQVPERRSGT